MDGAPADAGQPQYLTFVIAGEEYAVSVLRVREILQHQWVTRVPRVPPWIRGVINLRGNVVPVVDLAVKFGLPASQPTRTTCFVLTEVRMGDEPMVMGLMADAVRQVVELPPGAVQPPPEFGTRVRVDFLLGMARVEERLVLMLDVDRLLSADEVVAVAAVDAEAGEPSSEATDPRPEADGAAEDVSAS